MKRSLILNLCSWFLSLLAVGSLLANDEARKLTSENDPVNRQRTDAKYARMSSISDYISRAGKPYEGEMRVIHPSALPAEIPCERIQVGLRMGYKPNVRRLSTGELVMLNFHTHGETQGASDGSVAEHMVMHRSKDNGITWTSNHVQDVYGREPYLNVLSHDVMLVTGHVLTSDVNNPTKKLTCVIHRSIDGGKTWKTQPISPGMLPYENLTRTYSSRNIIELPDGTYMLCLIHSVPPTISHETMAGCRPASLR